GAVYDRPGFFVQSPCSQRRGGAKRRGGQFGDTRRRSDHPSAPSLRSAHPPLLCDEGNSRPQCIGWSGHVLPFLATTSEEIRPIRIRQAVVARWELSDFRAAVDSREHAVASLFNLAEQRIDVPADQLAF